MAKKVTIKDVAAAAGVSAMSVSKALNDKAGLSDETRRRILEVAKEMNYTQNLIAKSLRSDETMTLGVVLSDSSSLVTSKVVRGVYVAADHFGYSVIIANTDHSCQREKSAISLLVNKRIDGLLLVAPLSSGVEDIQWLRSFGTPTVFLMRQNNREPIDSVINDNYLGGYQIVEHLIREGGRKFSFLTLDRQANRVEDRMEGYKKALQDFRLDFDPGRVLYTAPFIEDGYRNAKKLLEKDAGFDALVCGCDTIAVGAMEALKEAGISVPQKMLVAGYDDIELADYLRVPLTTMRQPFYKMGYKGTEILLDRIKYPDMPVRQMVLKSELIVRDSSHPVEAKSFSSGRE